MVRNHHIPDLKHDVAGQSGVSGGAREAVVAPNATAVTFPARHHSQPNRVQVRERNSIWEVRVDGVFRGDYHKEEHALTAAVRFRKSL
ncbi:MAG: hypothetical protein ACQEVT_06380 [Pseudomonadota bacterium]|uniref:hypothetical protein n=1 Tax=Roseovarius TaxID=74030 RepID=UPI0022A6E5A3|nr:hypothetical protein [Roseovarius sp. EGI FJ00037]MCZ0810823.1 hypothetical protein [Roseovarius sp. EGI FJ00037]